MQELNERDGISIWRQIGEMLMGEIRSGSLAPDQRLPSSNELANRFGVNRHTVLRAISHLQAEGYVRVQRGRGTFAVVNKLAIGIGQRRWFEENLLDSNRIPTRTILAIDEMKASAEVAAGLQLEEGAPVFFVKMLSEADSQPVNLGYQYYPARRLPDIADVFRSFGDQPTSVLSFTKVFKVVGVSDFRRKSIRIRSRLPTQEEAWRLRIAQTEHVLETDVTNVDEKDVPVVYANTCYCSSRCELTIDL